MWGNYGFLNAISSYYSNIKTKTSKVNFMKKIYLLLFTILIIGGVFAQAPESMTYQAVL